MNAADAAAAAGVERDLAGCRGLGYRLYGLEAPSSRAAG